MSLPELRLGVNVDHVATVRQARGAPYPDPVEAALIAAQAGAHSITVHLREDRRHIQDHDVQRLLAVSKVPVNLEMAVTDEMVAIARRLKPAYVCLVPEKREERTTEGGLDIAGQLPRIRAVCDALADAGIVTSLFVDPDPGPVLANTGLENLRFLTPLYPGDSMRVELSVRSKSLKSEETGVVRWAVEIFNQRDELVATYDLLTENVP